MNKAPDPNVTSDIPSPPADSLRAADAIGTTDHVRGSASTAGSHPGSNTAVGDLPAVPGYRVLREIARGGMGRVLAALDLALDRDVALKVLLPGTNADRFVREAKITARLPHPGIPPVHALGTLGDGSPFLAMKLIAGQTLADEMKSADRPRLLQAFTQVCQAVGFAHSRGVVHRDLKPANIMVGAFGEVQVMDWGLAKDLTGRAVVDEPRSSSAQTLPSVGAGPDRTTDYGAAGESSDARTQAGQVLGTPAYMAPEQARGEASDARADVFALGGILCAILTGQPPFGGNSIPEVIRRAGAAALAEAHARLDACGADAELVALCRGCLSPRRRDRPADGQAVADRLTAYIEGVQKKLRKAELAEVEAKAKAVEEAKRRRLTLALAGTVLVAVTVGGGYWLWVKNEREARQAQVAGDVNDALNKATALRERAKSTSRGGAELFAQAREQAQRALALVENGPADAALKEQVRRLQADLDQEEKGRKLIAAVDEARLTQAETLSENRFALERAVPKFREALLAYGLPPGQGDPAAVAELIRQSPAAVREAIVAALDEWEDTASNPVFELSEPHRPWLRAVLEAAEPDDAWSRRVRAACQETDTGKRQGALEALAKSADVERLPALALNRLSGRLHPLRAAELLRRAQRQYPSDFWINHDLGVALGRVTPPEWDEAVRFLTAAVALRPDSPGAHYDLGFALRRKGQMDEAIACYRKAIEIDPKYAAAHVGQGIALHNTGKVQEAIASFRMAIEIDPKDIYAHNNLGFSLHAKGEVDEAITCYRNAIEIDPRYAKAHYNLGCALAAKGRVDDAIASFRKATEFDPGDANAQTNLGLGLHRRGRLDEAIACFRKVVELNPKYPNAHDNLSLALLGKGQLDEAIVCLGKAIELNPNDSGAYSNLGFALDMVGKQKEAIEAWRSAVRLEPSLGNTQYWLGKALVSQGRPSEALGPLGEAAKRLPTATVPDLPAELSHAERLSGLEKRLPALLAGTDRVVENRERLELGELCRRRGQFVAAARFSAEALAADPKLAADLKAAHRYHAARCAALAAAGKGDDAGKLDDRERTRLRQQALDWLRADLALWTRQLASNKPADLTAVQGALRHWQKDNDLAGVRDAAALATLPADEREALTRLWADVAALLQKAEEEAK